MYTEQVTFTGHSSFQVNTKYGPKTKNVFTDTQGREFQVWKADVAAQLLASMGQSVSITFEAKQNGEYINYDVKAATVIGQQAAQVAATAPQTAPVTTEAVQAAPPQQTGRNDEERQTRIMRQNAIGNAVLAFGAAGIDPVENSAELLEFAQEVLLNFYINGFQLPTTEEVTVDAGVQTAGPVA